MKILNAETESPDLIIAYQTPMRFQIRDLVIESIDSGRFSAAIFWGVLVCALLNIVELEYNLAALVSPASPSAGSGQLIGGFVAGYLYRGTRREALKAGGYAGGVPLLVFVPIALVLHIGTHSTVFSLESLLLQYALGFLLVYPVTVGVGALFGGVGGFAGYWLSKRRSRT